MKPNNNFCCHKRDDKLSYQKLKEKENVVMKSIQINIECSPEHTEMAKMLKYHNLRCPFTYLVYQLN